MARIRAGVLEWGSVDMLRDAGLGDRMMTEGFVHDGVGMSFLGQLLRIDFQRFTGKAVMIYGQTEVTKDLYTALDAEGVPIVDEAIDVTPHDVTTDAALRHLREGRRHPSHRLRVHRRLRRLPRREPSDDPGSLLREYEREYPFGWLGVLSETPPVDDELIYAHHERGFALCSMRHKMLSRYYVQCPLDDSVEDWSDERFWDELRAAAPR